MRYLIWDFDGTLGYREGGMWTGTLLEIVTEACPELGVTAEQLKRHLQVGYPWHTPERPHPELTTAEAWWDALMPVLQQALCAVGVPEERAGLLVRQFPARYTELSRWRLYPDSLPMLATLSAAGWQHLLLSNHVPELPAIIDHLALRPHLIALFNSAQTGYEKPHPQAFRLVLDYIGPAESVWMIGDNYTADVRGVEAVGIPGILVRKTHPEASYACAELSALAPILTRNLAGDRGGAG